MANKLHFFPHVCCYIMCQHKFLETYFIYKYVNWNKMIKTYITSLYGIITEKKKRTNKAKENKKDNVERYPGV